MQLTFLLKKIKLLRNQENKTIRKSREKKYYPSLIEHKIKYEEQTYLNCCGIWWKSMAHYIVK
jgi:hypothetical protein